MPTTAAAMADAVVLSVVTTIKLIRACVNKYTEFGAFEEECTTFRRSLSNVADILDDVRDELTKGSVSPENNKLQWPLTLLQAAVEEGSEVFDRCSPNCKLLALVFSQQRLGTLSKAKADVQEALKLLNASAVRIQVATQRMMDSVSERLDELHQLIQASSTRPSEVAELILRTETTQQPIICNALINWGVVTNAQDVADVLAELRREAESIRDHAKVVYDREILAAVLALTAPKDDDDGGDGGVRGPVTTTPSANPEATICPILKEVMRDPVTVFESGITYDREGLCTSLLLYPDLDPVTNQQFDSPLHYSPNLAIRSLISAQYGDSYYQKYDDKNFMDRYEAIWAERRRPPIAVDTEALNVSGTVGKGGGDSTGGYSGFDGLTGIKADSASAEPTSVHSSVSWTVCCESGDLSPGRHNAFPPHVLSISSAVPDDESQSPDPPLTQDVETAGKSGAKTEELGEGTQSPWGRCFRPMMKVIMVIVGVIIIIVLVPVVSWAISAANRPGEVTVSRPVSINEQFNLTLSLRSPLTMKRIQDTSSPQYRAYEWVTQMDQLLAPYLSDDATRLFRMRQRFALATLLYSIRGLEHWVNSTASECFWGDGDGKGTSCDMGSRLVAIDTYNTGSGGTIPPEIVLLTSLTSLNVGGNDLTSSIPTELGELTALSQLVLCWNDLTSPIPTELGLLTGLTDLRLFENALTSSIPTQLGLLTGLPDLGLGSNQLTSSIPTELGQLSALLFLGLAGNALTSSIPTELGRLTGLTRLRLDDNSLMSTIPTELGQLTNLEYLGLDNNSLTGTFPSALCYVESANGIFIDCSEVVCYCCGC